MFRASTRCSLKKSLPVLIALLIVAQIDLASAAAWPGALLSLLHLTPAPDDLCRGVCSGLGASLDVIVDLPARPHLGQAGDGSRPRPCGCPR